MVYLFKAQKYGVGGEIPLRNENKIVRFRACYLPANIPVRMDKYALGLA